MLCTAIFVVDNTESRLLSSTLGHACVLSVPMMCRLSSVDCASEEQQCDVGMETYPPRLLCDRSKAMLFGLGSDDIGVELSNEIPRPTS